MDNLSSWYTFESTGKVEDYLKYADEKRICEAREKFISIIESEKENGRNNYGGGNGNFLNGYK